MVLEFRIKAWQTSRWRWWDLNPRDRGSEALAPHPATPIQRSLGGRSCEGTHSGCASSGDHGWWWDRWLSLETPCPPASRTNQDSSQMVKKVESKHTEIAHSTTSDGVESADAMKRMNEALKRALNMRPRLHKDEPRRRSKAHRSSSHSSITGSKT